MPITLLPLSLPPGQQLAAPGKWPLVGERAPRASTAPWTLTIGGAVARPRIWQLAELAALPQTDLTCDIHCVTRWSKLAMTFRGIPLANLLAEAEPLPTAQYISFIARSDRDHSTSLALDDALKLGAFIAFSADGEPLSSEHGGPVRTIVPGRYFYKSLNRFGDGTKGGRVLTLRLEGANHAATASPAAAATSARDAIGAVVTAVTTTGRRTFRRSAGEGLASQNAAGLRLTLAPGESLRELQIRWPSGRTSTHRPKPGDSTLRLQEPASAAAPIDKGR